MKFDPNNKIIQFCIGGINIEGKGETENAYQLFYWLCYLKIVRSKNVRLG